MRKRLLIGLASLALLSTAGGAAWWKLRPADEPAPEEKTYEDIKREDMEAWMQDLGYTE